MRQSTAGPFWLALFAAFLLLIPASADTMRLDSIVPDYMPDDLETAIIPTPQRADLKSTAFTAGKILFVRPEDYEKSSALFYEARRLLGTELVSVVSVPDFAPMHAEADTIVFVGGASTHPSLDPLEQAAGLEPLLRDASQRGGDAYVLYSAAGGWKGKNVVLLAGNTPAGDFWAFTTLRQMCFPQGDTRHIREGVILDYPRFTWRGNKRPQTWEWRYKANAAFFLDSLGNEERVRFRRAGCWVLHGEPLRATDEEMDALLRGARSFYERGVRHFVIKFDDTGTKMSDPTKAKFGDANFFEGVHYLLRGMHKRLKALDPGNRVYFMPAPYAHNAMDLADYVEGLLSYGPLPEDIGLHVCGPEVISWRLPTACIRDYRERFGLTKTRAMIYDNLGRGGEYFPYSGREKNLWQEVEFLFPERGSAIYRITVFDYLWNPEAYDPDRALRLAVRELSSGMPEVYQPFYDFVSYYNEHRDFPDYPPREEAVRGLRQANATMKAKFEALAPVLEKSLLGNDIGSAGERGLRYDLWGTVPPKSSLLGAEYARLGYRLTMSPYMEAHGWRRLTARRVATPIRLDGQLDEPPWKTAPPSPEFVEALWGARGKEFLESHRSLESLLLPAEESTNVRVLYDSVRLYVGVSFAYREKPAVPGWARRLWQDVPPGGRGFYAWRVPCFEFFLDPTGRRDEYYQIVANVANVHCATRHRAWEKEKSGGWWRPDLKFVYHLGERRGTLEASVPLDAFGAAPNKGDVWGFQVFRSKIGTFGLFSGSYDMVGGEHGSREFGSILFD